MRRTVIGMLVFLLVSSAGMTADARPDDDRYVLDLSDVRLETDGIQRLTGEWAFWWGRFIDPAADTLPDADGTISIPGVWNGGEGYGSYARIIRLPSDTDELALFIPPASTAYRLYVDGVPVAASGTPGVTKEESVPLYRIRTVRVRPREDRIRVVAHVSNFYHRRGGLWRPIIIGTPEDVESWATVELVYDLFVAGGLFLMTLYLVALYGTGPRRSGSLTPLFAAAFFLSLAVRILVTGSMVATRVWTDISWSTQLRIEYTGAHAALAAFVWLFRSAFPRRFSPWFAILVSGYAIANAVVALVVPVSVYSRFVPIYALSMNGVFFVVTAVLVVAVIQRERYAGAYLGGALLALLAAVGEALQISPLFASREMAPLSLVFRVAGSNSLSERTLQVMSIGGSLLLIFGSAAIIVLRTSGILFEQLSHTSAGS
ncbi:MAG: 7TM diverse intracellular signaling domain-containing protein, partial [Alkalispirochaeta sp.]